MSAVSGAGPRSGSLDALVLCGGLGTRLAGVLDDRPKALAQVAGRSFLSILLEVLARQGVPRFVLCTGHRGDAIEACVPDLQRYGQVVVSAEREPLGTGGAVKLGLTRAQGQRALVCNGDSLCPFSLAELSAQHERTGASLTLAAVRDPERADAGQLRIGPEGRVESFLEKDPRAGSGLVSAGIYVLERSALDHPAASPERFSLETDLIPALVAEGRVRACPAPGPLLDIGTPPRLSGARSALDRMGLGIALG